MIKEGKEAKAFQTQLELADAVHQVREKFNEETTEPLKRLSRSAYTRQQLKEHGAIQAQDEQGTAAVLVEPQVYKSLLDYVELLEDQLETTNMETMLENRKGDTGFVSGVRLSVEALEIFDSNKAEIRRFLDDDK